MRIIIRLFVVSFVVFIVACSNQYPNQNLSGQQFPSVEGSTLEQKKFIIPDDFKANLTLLLIGYKQNSQFDIDRWLIGLDMTQTKIDAYEIPTIQGMFPQMFSTFIDNGMRSGIPKELWKGVITVYQDGEQIQALTGNKNPNNARVVLINRSGKILYFYDRGFSVSALNDVRDTITLHKKGAANAQ